MTAGVIDTVNNPRHPFGLPLGTIRALLSLLICGFVWMVLLWPGDQKLPLSHFFLMALVLLAFSTSPSIRTTGESTFMPWLLRVLFVGGSVGVVLYSLVRDADSLRKLTPTTDEFAAWWGPYLAVLAGGFAVGLFLRFVLGRENMVFQTLRAWLSVIGLVMMLLEFVLFLAFASVERRPEASLHVYQAVQLAVVSAYFGTRA
jgi:hypothetical protein